MSHKENIAPLSTTRRRTQENSFENLKGETLSLTKNAAKNLDSKQQKQLSLKENFQIHTDKKGNVEEKDKNAKIERVTRSKSNFAHANKIPTASTQELNATTTTFKPLVFKDDDDEVKVKQKPVSSRNEERPMLLNQQNKERVQIHHKPLKSLQTPIVDVESKEITRLKEQLKEKEEVKEKKVQELNQLQELLKVYKEYEEQQSMLAEAEEMITTIYESFDELFSSTCMSYTMRFALKEQQQELLLNELSEINYRLSGQAEEGEDSD